MKPISSFFNAFCLAVIFFITSLHITNAQTAKDTLLAYQHYQKADSLLQARKMDSSIVYFKRAIPIYEKAKAWERLAACYNGVSDNQLRIYKLEQALINAKTALSICQKFFSEYHFQVAYAYDNMAKFYLRSSNMHRALELYTKALEIRKQILPEIHFERAKSYSNLALIYTHLSEYKKAIYYNRKALEIMIEVLGPDDPKNGVIYNNLGVIYERFGRFDESIRYYEKKIEIISKVYGEEHLLVAQTFVNIGGVLQKIRQDNLAIEYYKKALKFYNKNKINTPDLAVIYNNIGVVLMDNGEHDKALEYYKKALKIDIEILGKDHAKISSRYLNIGSIYSAKNESNKALIYYNKALHLIKPDSKKKLETQSELYFNIGYIYKEQKQYDLALEYYQKSSNILIKLFGDNYYEVAERYSIMSDTYFIKSNDEKALFYLEKALRILKNKNLLRKPILTNTLNRVAEIYYTQKEYSNAIKYYNEALKSNTKNTIHLNKIKRFNIDNYYDSWILISTLKGKAKSFSSLYKINKNKSLIDSCFALYRTTDSLLFKMNQTYQNYKDKLALAEEAKNIYEESIILQLIENKNYKNKKALNKAFYYSERSKSNILQELLNDVEARNQSLVSKDFHYFYNSLRANKSFYQSQILNERSNTNQDTSKIREYENKLFDINRKQDSVTKTLEKTYPKYYQLKYQNNIVSVKQIQKQLENNTTLLEFFTADSTTYAFTISKNDIAVHELATPQLTDKVEAFRTSIISKDVATYKKQAHLLYTTLIAPVANKLVGDNLIIIPDASLWHLNFDLLLTKKDDSNNPALLSYMLREYAITYANSANLLFQDFKNETETKTTPECLAFSFSDSTQITDSQTMRLAALRNTGADLPGTRKEIKAISNIIDGEYYFGSNAIEANFKKNADRYAIIHLALHGEVDNEHPENSKLFFTKTKDTLEDNNLYSHELFALDIPAELAVLSACNTGTGKIAKGEGIMSLGTAFQYAGTKSLVLTGWEVSDKTTPEIMQYFYTNLKEGMNKGKALQQAKLQYLTTADINRTDPFYWGGFYLVGNPDPMHFVDNTFIYCIFGLGILSILVFVGWQYRKRLKNR